MGRYYQRDTTSNWGSFSLSYQTGTSATYQQSVPAGSSVLIPFDTPDGIVSWPSGNVTVRLDVTAVGSSTTWTAIGLSRVASGTNTVRGTRSSFSVSRAGTGLLTETVSWTPPSNASTTDLLRADVVFTNTHMMSAETVTLRLNTADSYIDVPWSATPPTSLSATMDSDSINLSWSQVTSAWHYIVKRQTHALTGDNSTFTTGIGGWVGDVGTASHATDALRITFSSTFNMSGYSPAFAATPGVTYGVTANGRISGGTWSTGVMIHYFDSSGARIGTDLPSYTTATTSYQSRTNASVAPANTVTAKVFVSANSPSPGVGQYMEWDDVAAGRLDSFTVNAPTTSYNDTTALANTTYTYTVRSIQSWLESADSNSDSETTGTLTLASSIDADSINLSWNQPTGTSPTSYTVYRTGGWVSESFDQADSTTLGPSLTWTEGGDAALWTTGGIVYAASASTTSTARAEVDLGGDDNWAEVEVASLPWGPTEGGSATACCRFVPDTQTYYAANLAVSVSGGYTIRILKSVAGTVTHLGSGPVDLTFIPGARVKIEAVGSTITAYVNGVQVQQVTDTSITTGTRAGIRIFRGGSSPSPTITSFTAGPAKKIVTGLTGTSYDDTSAVAGNTYTYTVRSVASGIESTDSNADSETTGTLTLTATGDADSINLAWNQPTGTAPTSYTVYRTGPENLTTDDATFAGGVGSWVTLFANATEVSVSGGELRARALQANTSALEIRTGSYPVLPSTTYKASMFIRHVAGTARNMSMSLEWRTSANAVISLSGGSSQLTATTASYYDVTATSPSNAAYVRVHLYNSDTAAINDEVAIDNASLIQTSTFTGITGTTYDDTTALSDITYDYFVRAVYGAGTYDSNVESESLAEPVLGSVDLSGDGSLTASGIQIFQLALSGTGHLSPVQQPRIQASDDFNRADGALGSNWISSSNPVSIASNQVVDGAGVAGAIWNRDFGVAQFSQVTMRTLGASVGPMVKATIVAGSAIGGDPAFYRLTQISNLLYIWLQPVEGSLVALVNVPYTPALGDVLRLEYGDDGVLRGFVNGTLMIEHYPTVHLEGRGVGFYNGSGGTSSGQAVLDDWSGGDLGVDVGGDAFPWLGTGERPWVGVGEDVFLGV